MGYDFTRWSALIDIECINTNISNQKVIEANKIQRVYSYRISPKILFNINKFYVTYGAILAFQVKQRSIDINFDVSFEIGFKTKNIMQIFGRIEHFAHKMTKNQQPNQYNTFVDTTQLRLLAGIRFPHQLTNKIKLGVQVMCGYHRIIFNKANNNPIQIHKGRHHTTPISYSSITSITPTPKRKSPMNRTSNITRQARIARNLQQRSASCATWENCGPQGPEARSPEQLSTWSGAKTISQQPSELSIPSSPVQWISYTSDATDSE